MNTIQYVRDWVSTKESFSFFLPDGPHGRPFDNQYQMDGIVDGQGVLLIRLAGGIEFLFEGRLQYRDEACNLILTGFTKLKYKVNGVVECEFTEGEFCLTGF